MTHEARSVGLSLKVPLGLGAMHWGDGPLDKALAGKIIPRDELQNILVLADRAGIELVDTAEGYGGGRSEARIGRLLSEGNRTFVATKFLPTLFRWRRQAVVRAAAGSLTRLRRDSCDLYLIHSPVHFRKPEVWIRGAADAHRQGLIGALGVSNFGAEEVRGAARIAREEGVPLVANQIMYSLLTARSSALQETVQACRDEGLTVLTYAVLGQGLLTEGLTRERFEAHRLARRTRISWENLTDLRREIQRLAGVHRTSMSQVCLRWAIESGTVPLVGTRTVAQLADTLGVLGWNLGHGEKEVLDALALGSSTFTRPRWKRLAFLAFLTLLVQAYRISAQFRARDS